MSEQIQETNSPSVMTEEGMVEFMKKSKSLQEWKIREEHLKKKLGTSFNRIWIKTILLSGVAEEMLRKFENVEIKTPDKDLWDDVKLSDRVAPLI